MLYNLLFPKHLQSLRLPLISRSIPRLIPTSIITAPGFIMSFVINFDFPMATINMSACFVYFSMSSVFEWQTVTVAFLLNASCIHGFPTILLLPKMTTCFPCIEILYFSNNSIIPAGVQEIKPSCPKHSFPTFIG